jgi:hypothetical protein
MGQAQAVAILRTALMVLLVLNLVPLTLLFANLRPTHARLYTRAQQWGAGAFIFACGMLIPLVLTIFKGGLPFISAGLLFLLLGNWVVRFVYVKIPHTGLKSGLTER